MLIQFGPVLGSSGGAEEGGGGMSGGRGGEGIVGEEVPTFPYESGNAAGGGTIDVEVQLYKYICSLCWRCWYFACKYVLKKN